VAALGHDPEERDHPVVAGRPERDVLRPPALPALAPALEPREKAVVAAVDAGVRDVEVDDLDLGIEGREGGLPVLPHGRLEPPPHQLDVLL
jgi:hypothetical protein